VPLDRQPVPLERVREDHRRPAVVDPPVRVPQRAEVVPAEVAYRRGQLPVRHVRDEPGDRGRAGAVAGQRVPQLGRRPAQQPLVLGVGHLVDPVPQRRAAGAGEQLLQQPAVLDREHLPAGRGEHALQLRRAHHRQHPVQRLAVEVDDPDHLAELGHHRVEHGLPDRALVQLGVADQRPLPAPAAVIAARTAADIAARTAADIAADIAAGAEVAGDVPAGQRAPDRGGRADADRAGGVVGRDRVLEPARVALQAAELPQRGQVRRVEVTEQVLQRVQHRRRVRLHRDPVLGPQLLQPQRGHDRHHRGAGRLVAADLEPARVRPDPVGVVDDRRRQPQHPLLHRPQRGIRVQPLHRPGHLALIPGPW
jgi:hypothetical protein